MIPSREHCLAALRSRDPRFDGWFITGVHSTGIYCRPSCPASTPKASNVVFYPSAAAAQNAGLRACKRCRPDSSPGSPEWNVRADVVARTMRLIGEGVVDREGVAGLSRRLGYSVRQIERQVSAELGASPIALARAQRAQTARILIETTALPLTQVAFAAGFGSIRSFNDTVQAVFATSPRRLRGQRAPATAGPGIDGSPWHQLGVRLPFRRPLCPDNLFGHLVATGVPGVEEWRRGSYRRTIRLTDGPAIVELRPEPDHVAAVLRLHSLSDLTEAIAVCRRLLDLDADPEAVDSDLSRDARLAPLVAAAPGRRVPGTVDGAELAIRIVLGQQISTRAARTHGARLVRALGAQVCDPAGGLTHLFPDPAAVADCPEADLAMPHRRRDTLRSLAGALARHELDLSPSADRAEMLARLGQLPGIGPWTVQSVAMRALGDPDAFVGSDLGIHRAMAALGLPDRGPAQLAAAQAWSPWRAYAVQHLWATSDHEVNHLPTTEPLDRAQEAAS